MFEQVDSPELTANKKAATDLNTEIQELDLQINAVEKAALEQYKGLSK